MRILNLWTALVLSTVALLILIWGLALSPATASGTRYVAPSGMCGGATPCYATIQAAINEVAPGDEIRVAQGVYTTVSALEYALGGWMQTITQVMFIDESLTVRGGYTTTDWTAAQPVTHPTVIDPQGRGRGGVVSTPDGGAPITVTLTGLSITQGQAEGSGGGLYIQGASVTISGCHISHNHGSSIGSGLYLGGNRMALTNNVIEQNTGPAYSYGVVAKMGFPTLSGNHISHHANGLLLWNTEATLINNLITANEGTGLAISGGIARAWHTTVADNGTVGVNVTHAGQGAGRVVMTNTIIAGSGTGVEVIGNEFDPSTAQLAATLWDNVTDTQIVEPGGSVTHIQDYRGDPGFVGGGDYHLTATSPARNRGWFSRVRQDADGEPRDPLPDLGADEYFDPGSIRQVYLPMVAR